MVIAPEPLLIRAPPLVPVVIPTTASRALGADEAYEDDRRLLRRWQDRVDISQEAYRLLNAERTAS